MTNIQNNIYRKIKKIKLLHFVYIIMSRLKATLRKRLPDEEFLRVRFKEKTGKALNLINPVTYNEKMQWLKLYDRNPLYTKLSDKYAVREYYKEKIGEEYLIPTYGVYDSFDQINFDALPDQFVMKCTHDCGSFEICTDKRKFDRKRAKKRFDKALKRNYYWIGREWNYKNIRPRIIVEKYLVDESKFGLKDHRVFCFNGKVELIVVDFNKAVEYKRNLYDVNWNFINATIQHPNDENVKIKKPSKLNEMIRIAEILSVGMPHIRVDLYSIDDKIYCGEITLYNSGGMGKFTPESLEVELGALVDLSLAYKNGGSPP